MASSFTKWQCIFSLIATIAFFLQTPCSAHMCLLNPYQRGGMVNTTCLDRPGCAHCGYNNVMNGSYPCYGSDKADERLRNVLATGSRQVFVVQKNLDHYGPTARGNFSVNIFLKHNMVYVLNVGSVQDTNDTSGTIYQIVWESVSGLVSGETYVVQAQYNTNNAGIGTFYQCSDAYAL